MSSMATTWMERILRHAEIDQGLLKVRKPASADKGGVAYVKIYFRNTDPCVTVSISGGWKSEDLSHDLVKKAGDVRFDLDAGIVEVRRKQRELDWLIERSADDDEVESEMMFEDSYVEYRQIEDIIGIKAGHLRDIDLDLEP